MRTWEGALSVVKQTNMCSFISLLCSIKCFMKDSNITALASIVDLFLNMFLTAVQKYCSIRDGGIFTDCYFQFCFEFHCWIH